MVRARCCAPLLLVLPVFLSLAAASVGCSDDGPGEAGAARERGTDRVGGSIVATVDGVGITVADVEAHTGQSGQYGQALTTPRDALMDLEEQELLAAEAERRGYDVRRQTHRSRARARARKLLQVMVEDRVTPASIADAVIAARYQRDASRYHQPERRGSRHLLIRVPEGADPGVWALAEAQSRGVLREAIAAAPEVAEIFGAVTAPTPLTVVTEVLEPVAHDGTLQLPYSDALFSTEPGRVHPETVRTTYGVHVILVESVVPAADVSLADASARIRQELVIEARGAAASELVQRLAGARPIEVNDAAFARAAVLEFEP